MHLHMTEITINLTIDQDDESFLFTELQHGPCVAMMWSIFDQKCGKAANAKNLENAIFVGNVEDLYN